MGGSGTATSDPDISVGLFSWSSPSLSRAGGRGEQHDGISKTKQTAATAPAPTGASLATRDITGSSVAPVLTRLVASQEGDIPAARIGHAAVTMVDPASSSSSRPASIILFGGEASNPTPATSTDDDSGSLVYPKLDDVYEGIPKAPSGTLVWRALPFQRAVSETPREASPATTAKVGGGAKNGVAPIDSEDVPLVPSPMAFHASCAALVSSSGKSSSNSIGDAEPAMMIHGGMDESSQLLGDLWAFFPARRSEGLPPGEKGAAEASDVGRRGSSGASVITTGWERLQPEGEGSVGVEDGSIFRSMLEL